MRPPDDDSRRKKGTRKMKALGMIVIMLSLISAMNASVLNASDEDVVLPHLPRISVEELRKMIDEGGDHVTVDTRDGGSYGAGHIKGAINIHYDPTSDPMARQMMLIALPMDKLIVTYCDCTDDANSAQMAEELYQLGYDRDKIKVLSGGSLRWVELKYPLVKSE
jgi:rhodanese-related sulfurtransferase